MSGSGGEPLAEVLLGVRGMEGDEAQSKVMAAVETVPGVASVEGAGAGQLIVRYDAAEVTVMDVIRAVRRVGFLAGMV